MDDKIIISNLAAMLRRMVWMAEKEAGDSSMKVIAGKAKELLAKYDLQGSALRDAKQGRYHESLNPSHVEGWTTMELLVPNLGWSDQKFTPLNKGAAEQPEFDNPRDVFAAPDRTPRD